MRRRNHGLSFRRIQLGNTFVHMEHVKNNYTKKAIYISLSVTILLVLYAAYGSGRFDSNGVISGLVLPLCRLIILIAAGLAFGQVIEAVGWTRFLAWLARPVFRFSNLSDHCGSAFTTAFFSSTAANTMLADFYNEGKICRQELFLTCFLNQLPAYFLHVPSTFLVVLPLTGMAGILYFLLTFLALMLRTSMFLFYGRMNPSIQSCEYRSPGSTLTHEDKKTTLTSLKKRFLGRLTGITVFVVPIYTAVFVLNAKGVFESLRMWMAGFIVHTFIPMESLSVIIISLVAEFTSGFAAAGAMLDAGILTTKQTVLALLIGNIIAFPVRALRHQLPNYIGIFSPKMGIQLLLMGQGFRVISLITVGAVYYFL